MPLPLDQARFIVARTQRGEVLIVRPHQVARFGLLPLGRFKNYDGARLAIAAGQFSQPTFGHPKGDQP